MTAEIRNLRLRGFTAVELDRQTNQKNEIYLDSDYKTLRISDGSARGGFSLLRDDLSNIKSTALNKTLNFGTGTLTSSHFYGPLTGNVTGNLTGNVTGNLTGNVTGNVTGTVTNGVVTTGSYANPSWITSLSTSKLVGNITADVTGNIVGNVTGNVSGNAGTATSLATARTINGVAFNGTANITVTADADTLTNTTLAQNIVTSSLTTVGTLGTLSVDGNITAPAKPTLKTHATNRGYVDKKAVAMAVALG